jgi:alpha-L-rhamnosidase
VILWIGAAGLANAAEPSAFLSAKPVWPKGRETEMNLLVGFRAVIDAPEAAQPEAVLRVAASTIYRAWLNGEFLGHGPARGPHGFFRIDQWPLAGKLKPGKNLVAIEVAGYNCNSYYLLDQPSFLQAEVVAGQRVLASTAGEGAAFAATVLTHRVQKVQRYSFQRPFIEVYRLAPGWDRWLRETDVDVARADIAVQPAGNLLPRRVPCPEFAVRRALTPVGAGVCRLRPKTEGLWKDRALTAIGPKLKGFPERDLERAVSTEMQQYASVLSKDIAAKLPAAVAPTILGQGVFQIFDFGLNLTGFPGLRMRCDQKTRIALAFDEILTDGDVDFKRLGCTNVIWYELQPGTYQVEAIEPYTMRYLKLMCLEGGCTFQDVYLREYAHPQPKTARFASSDERLNRLYAAGVLTFRQNCLDLFMDCPSRERAGWLCDSFFTARVAADLTGVPLVERNFFENYLLPDRFAHLPDGMLPMCYPADHYDGVFIPNWAMWFVVQLDEYAQRSGDRATVEALRPKVMKLLDYFKRFENSDGLLEKLESWVFVEWSKANDFVQDVNYPSNMLYAAALAAAGRLYGRPDLAAKADALRETIRRQSFDGEFFVDNAVRRDGKLEATRNRSEVCQYFAFFFGTANRSTHAKLWETLRDRFGPDRPKTKAFAEIHPANSFVGNVLRLELLSQAGRSQQILDESIAYLLYMADRTGTLWENVGAYASCNHGFASHVVHTLYRDVLGLRNVDPANKALTVRFGNLKLDWCEGSLATPDGPIELRWEKQADDRLVYRLQTPPGYRVTIENDSGLRLEAVSGR